MSQNLTKRTSDSGPVRQRRAKAEPDDRVHLTDAGPVDLVDPSPLRTYCGAAVFEVYGDDREVTCPACADA